MDSSLLKYKMAKLMRAINQTAGVSVERDILCVRYDRLSFQYRDAQRLELERLAKHLNYKADVYYPGLGRIYPGSDGRGFYTREVSLGVTGIFHGDTVLNPDHITDGHGNTVYVP